MFSSIKVGDKVWSIANGWGVVVKLDSFDVNYPITVHHENDGLVYVYTTDGKYMDKDSYPTLFWSEFEVPKKAFIKHLQKLEVDTKLLVWEDENYKYKRYFAKYSNKGRVICYKYGLTSWTSDVKDVSEWNNWEVVEDDTTN